MQSFRCREAQKTFIDVEVEVTSIISYKLKILFSLVIYQQVAHLHNIFTSWVEDFQKTWVSICSFVKYVWSSWL